MKKYIKGFLVCAVLVVLLGADVDRRNLEPFTHKVFRIEAARVTHSSTATAADSTTEIINGVIRQISVTVNNNTNDVTADVEIRDADGDVLWACESDAAENATTVYTWNTVSGTDIPMAIMCAGTMTIWVEPSGAPGTSTMTTDVVLWGD
jgi:hypothetical protein